MAVDAVVLADRIGEGITLCAIGDEWRGEAWIDALCAVDPAARWEPAAVRRGTRSEPLSLESTARDDRWAALLERASPEGRAAAVAHVVERGCRRAELQLAPLIRELQDSALERLECMVALRPDGGLATDADAVLLRIVLAGEAIGGLRARQAWQVAADALLDRGDPRGEAVAWLLPVHHRLERRQVGRSAVFDWRVAEACLGPRQRERLVALAAACGALGRRDGEIVLSVPLHPR
jgi:hypothetical protein